MRLSINKLLNKTLLITLVILNSCTLPTEIIEPKINGEKINRTFGDISGITIDPKDNLYIVDENVIKKLDTKTNELTVVAGKEKSDIYPNNGIIDGDIQNAKFGKIQGVHYSEKENSIYFNDTFYYENNRLQKSSLRKIENNKVISIATDYSYVGIRGERYILDENNLNVIELDGTKFNYKLDDLPTDGDNSYKHYFTDSQGLLYLLYSAPTKKELYIKSHDKWIKIIYTPSYFDYGINYFLDRDNNLYVIEDKTKRDLVGKSQDFYSPTILYKVPKKDISMITQNTNLLKSEYEIGSMDIFIQTMTFTISYDLKKAFVIKENESTNEYKLYKNSIYKMNIGK